MDLDGSQYSFKTPIQEHKLMKLAYQGMLGR